MDLIYSYDFQGTQAKNLPLNDLRLAGIDLTVLSQARLGPKQSVSQTDSHSASDVCSPTGRLS